MEQQSSKGKPVTTSVPSIAIKFHANAEQLEEFYPASDEEHSTANDTSTAGTVTSTAASNESDSSPLKYLPRLVKRSTSIDITSTTKLNVDASPPSDPWRFFSDIKGKITKSVEEKITEIKARNQDEGSPLKTKTVKDSKDNSSVSDSEDLSESSISKTCGIVSTTEGAEMSSDDEDTPAIERDKKKDYSSEKPRVGLRQRFRLLKNKNSSTPKEGTIPISGLAKLYNINTERVEQALPEDGEEIESGVDVLEYTNLQQYDGGGDEDTTKNKILKGVAAEYDNIVVDSDDVINIKLVHGYNVRQKVPSWSGREKTVFSPVGFVDLRFVGGDLKKKNSQYYWLLSVFVFLLVIYLLLQLYSRYLAGFIAGIGATYSYFWIKSLFTSSEPSALYPVPKERNMYEIPAIKEYQPLSKYEGWLNEFPQQYNPHTYHVNQTQSVYLRLQGNILRLSHTRHKIPKRALWNEPIIRPSFTTHRIYNLIGAKIVLLPEGLAKKRHWSKKYPICITLSKSQMNLQPEILEKTEDNEDDKAEDNLKATSAHTNKKRSFTFKKKKYPVVTQRFSKLTEEEEEYEMDSDNSRPSSPSPSPDLSEDLAIQGDIVQKIEELHDNLQKSVKQEDTEEDADGVLEDWASFTPDDSPTETKLYLFARTDREKEDWFRKLTAATHKGAQVPSKQYADQRASISETLIDNLLPEEEYVKYMLLFNKTSKRKKRHSQDLDTSDKQQDSLDKLTADQQSPETNLLTKSFASEAEETPSVDLMWINALAGRVLFDCLRDPKFTERVKDRIQRKLAAIKLPYFIEELLCTELSLGLTPPFIHKVSKPVLDERGLWIDLDLSYEGLVILTLQTKLNLMKLKQPHALEKSSDEHHAMFNSDVDDSAESTSDDDYSQLIDSASTVDEKGVPVRPSGGPSTTSKRFVKMVDKIAESRLFQAASENRYIKRAMEGVSNTELRLKVEVKELIGTLVMNVPAPPTDRIWLGFRPVPHMTVTAQPIVGERNITMLRITGWIEKRLRQEFQKIMVIPNMEDFIIPVMDPKLPQ